MNDEVQPAIFLADRLERGVDLGLICHVARHNERIRQRAGEALDILLQPLALVGERHLGAVLRTCRRTCPSDRPLVGDAKDHPDLILKQFHKREESLKGKARKSNPIR